MRRRRVRLAAACSAALVALALGAACVTAPADKLGVEEDDQVDVPRRAYRPPPRWLRRVPPPVLWAEDVPPSCVLIETQLAIGNGTIIHSSREHGTFVLTTESLAVAVVSDPPGWARVVDGTQQLVGFPIRPREGQGEGLRAHREVIEQVQKWRAEPPPLDDMGAMSDEDLVGLATRCMQMGVWLGGSDFAVLQLDTGGRQLPAASIAAVSPADTSELRVVSIVPDRGKIATKAHPVARGLTVRETEAELREAQLGSGLFDDRGRIHGIAGRVIRAARDGGEPTEITYPDIDRLHDQLLRGAVDLGKLFVAEKTDRAAVEDAVKRVGAGAVAASRLQLRTPHVALVPADRIRDYLRREGLEFIVGPEPAVDSAAEPPPGGR